jgi:hypothetical protein
MNYRGQGWFDSQKNIITLQTEIVDGGSVSIDLDNIKVEKKAFMAF